MKTEIIKIYLKPDRETGCYYADMVTDVSPRTIRYVFDSLTSSHDGMIIESKIKHTKGYIFKNKIKSFIKKTFCGYKGDK